MNKLELERLDKLARTVRENILNMAEKGGCFLGAAYSCVDIIVYLYERFMNFNFQNPGCSNRDLFFLSKGHAVPALYGYFVEKEMLSYQRLGNHQSVNDVIYLHPNPSIPGIECHSGSLGHLLSVAVGAALNFKSKQLTNRVIVVLGDGELNEGSIWESLLIASAQHLDNLLIIIDRNQFQANFKTEDLIPLEPLSDKFEAFGCLLVSVYGHSFNCLEECFSNLPMNQKKPVVVIANTTRGKGIKNFENDWDKWFVQITPQEKTDLFQQLQTNSG